MSRADEILSKYGISRDKKKTESQNTPSKSTNESARYNDTASKILNKYGVAPRRLTDVEKWVSESNYALSGLDSYYSRWKSKDDSEHYNTTYESKINGLLNEAAIYRNQYSNNKEALNYIAEVEKLLKDSLTNATKAKEHWEKFKTEDEYNDAVKAQEEYDAKVNFDLDAGMTEIEGLLNGDEITALRKRQVEIQDQMRDFGNHSKGQGATKRQELQKELNEINAQIKEIENQASQKKAYYNQAKYIQDGIKLADDAKNAEDFEENSQYVSTKYDGFSWDKFFGNQYGMGYADLTYEYINGNQEMRDEINSEHATWDGNSADSTSPFEEKALDYMNDDEIAIYNYFYTTEGKAKANEFLDSIQQSLNNRKGQADFGGLEDNTFLELLFGVEAGLDQFESGIKNLFNTSDSYIPTTATQVTSGMVREDLADDGFKILGNSVGQIGYDLINTTSHMMPSILTSAALSYVNPVLGQAVGAGLMGASAGGNAYQEMLNLGYDKGQARGYSLLVGASEAGLQYALGGIGKLGGVATKGLTAKIATKLASNVDKAFAKIAITTSTKLVGNVVSEFGEEYLQDVLTPVFKNIALNTDEDIKLFSAEALYSGFLGALSAGLLEGGSTISGEVGTYKAGKSVIDKGQLGNLTELGKTYSPDSEAFKLASGVNENTDAYTVGQLLHEVGADSLTESNIAEIEKSLLRKGVIPEDAQTIAKWIYNASQGAVLSKSQQSAIFDNPDIVTTLKEVAVNPKSTVNQRIQGYQEILDNLEKRNIDAKPEATPTAEEKTSQGTALPYSAEYIESVAKEFEAIGMSPENAKKMDMAQLFTSNPTTSSPTKENLVESKFEVSADGKTINTKSGDVVNIKNIESISEGGEANLTLDDGMVVKASDLSFGSDAEALFVETIGAIKVGKKPISTNSANLLYMTAMSALEKNPKMTANEAMSLIKGLEESYVYGSYNLGRSKLNSRNEDGSARLFAGELSQEQRKFAYELGTQDRVSEVERDQKVIDDLKAKAEANKDTSTKITTKKGKVRFENGVVAKGRLQKRTVALAKHLARAIGIDIVFYDAMTTTNEDGKGANGYFDVDTDTIYLDLQNSWDDAKTIAFTLSHELVHFIKKWSPAKFDAFAKFLMENYAKHGVDTSTLLSNKMTELGTNDSDYAYEEMICDACETMLLDSNAVYKLMELRKTDLELFDKIKLHIHKLLNLIRDMYKSLGLNPTSDEAKALLEMKDVLEQIYSLFEEAAVDAVQSYQATIGSRNLEDFSAAETTDGNKLFQYKAMKADENTYRQMLKKWGKMTDAQIDNLFSTIDRAMDIIKDNLEVLDYAWESDIDDRAFSPVKPNSDSLYQVSLDFSTLCRKRILQQTVQAQLQEALNQPLSREEGIAIRDALIALQEEGRQIEVACALCYVESARMKSPAQIKKFLNNREAVLKDFFAGKSGGSMKNKIKQAETTARENLHKENPNGIKGKDGSMLDPRTAALNAMPKKYADAIRSAKKSAKESYKPTAEEQKLINVAKAMTVSDFTSPEGLENLAKNYPALFDAYTSYVRNATKSKGIEGDTWWRAGDSQKIGDVLIANMNRENGLRSQSWSDFQVIHILDYIAATIELSTRNAKEQAYSKVPDYVELMGQTGVMINMSLIPTRDFNGSLEYDSVEGMAYQRALELREKYPATAGTICIGVDNKQIQMLLADANIDYVIPYHKSGMAASIRKLMHIPTWSQYEEYQSEKTLSRKDAEAQAKKYGVTLLAESDPNYHKHTSFSEWFDLEVAKQIAKMENANPSNKAMQKKYGVMYGGYMAMQDAANNYLKLCAERGIAPKFSHEKANFTAEDNYWKLLIDRKMVNNATGEIIEQQTIKPIFDEGEVLRILNDELERYPSVKADQEYAIRKVTEKFLSGDIKSGMSAEAIAKVMQKPVDNIIKTNIIDSDYTQPKNIKKQAKTLQKKDPTKLKEEELINLLEFTRDKVLDDDTFIPVRINTPQILIAFAKEYGYTLDNHPLAMRVYKARQAVSNEENWDGSYKDKPHDLLPEEVVGIIKAMNNPSYLVFQTENERFAEIVKFEKEGSKEKAYAIVDFSDENKNPDLMNGYKGGKYNILVTVYPSEDAVDLKQYLSNKKHKVITGEEMKKKGLSQGSYGSNVPSLLNDSPFYEDIITQEGTESQEKTVKKQVKKSPSSYSPTFYSQMGKVVEGIKMEKIGAASVLNFMKGKVKKDEIKWSGIETFLEGKKSVTKQELLDFINGSMLQIGEEMAVDEENADIVLWQSPQSNVKVLYIDGKKEDIFRKNEYGQWVSDAFGDVFFDEQEILDQVKSDYARNVANTNWSQYKLDGGTNYRELVFTMPNSTYSNRAMRGHWGQDAEGVLVHARIQDFDVNGKKMLFIEEIQSDWHNEGHSEGYSTKEYEDAVESQDKLYNEYKKFDLAFHKYVRSNEFMTDPEDVRKKKHDWLRGKAETAQKKYLDAEKVVNSLHEKGAGDVPDAPFKDTYHEFVLKRLLRMAAEEGYDSIGWTPADIQSKRWSYDYEKAYKIEYDQDIPKFLKKYGKQWGATVGKTALGAFDKQIDIDSQTSMDDDSWLLEEGISFEGTEVWSMDITDSMKNSVLYEGQAMFQQKKETNRTILANALEGTAQNDIEKNKLAEYKQKISLIESEEQRLSEIQKQLFTKGAVEPSQRKDLQFEAKQIANRINTYDRQLLNLESTTALKNVLNREKALAAKRQKQKDAEAMKEYKEKVAKTTRELLERNQESRKKAIEGREKTAMRHKIKTVVNDLNNLLLKPSKERHVPEEMRIAVAEALSIVNMDTVDAETRVAKYNELIAKAKDPDVIASLTETRDRILNQGTKLADKLTKLKDAYGMVRDSADDSVRSMYDDVIYNKIEYVQRTVGKTPLRNMTLAQLESVYDLYKMVLTTIRDSNKAFAENITMTRLALGSNTFGEIKDNNKTRDTIKHPSTEKFLWQNLKPMQAMKTIGSETLQKLWNNILYGQEVFAVDYDEAVKFAKEMKDKYGYKKWNLDKLYSFESKSGKVMKINLEQMMSIYAYSKRKQADEHIEYGGIVLNEGVRKVKNKLGKVVEVKVNDSTAYRLDKMQVGEIIATLKKEFPGAKDFVDEMQKYLSETMGEKGNEVSMKMYGIKLFKEEHYFPLKSSKDFMEAANAKLKGDVKIKNKGMTKSTVEHARNPIVLENFLDVWGNHINEMALYHGLVLPLEDFSRTLNYSFKADEKLNSDAESVRTALHDAFGDNADNYLNELLKAINGGVLHDSSAQFADKMISKFKKAKVMASLSVIVQQPTAVVRAMGIIEPKYFVAQSFHHKATWEELKKYCPTAIIKETGSFDTNMGRTIVDMVKDERGFTDKVGDFLGKAPAYMDEVGWNMIWRALKNKVATEQKLSGEALLQECGKQMTLIINETQVYDSVMSRNELMRSKNALTKMATAFMAEPSTVANMIYGAGLDFKRGKKGMASKTVAAVISSVVINGLVSALVYAARDDDEEKTLLEKYLSSATTEVTDGINPLTYIPFIKDVYSLLQGYKVERTDMALFKDVVDAIDDFFNVLDPEVYEGMSKKEIAKHIYDNSVPLLTSICDVFGLPVGNILRDVKSIVINDNVPMSQTSSSGIGYAFKEGAVSALPKFVQKIIGNDSKQDKLYDAIVNGDTAYIDRLKSGYKDDKAYETAVRKALRENDTRIKEAAEARIGGDIAEYSRIVKEIKAEGFFSQDTIVASVNAEINAINKGESTSSDSTTEDKATSIYKMDDYYASIVGGDQASAYVVKEDIIQTDIANGKDRDEAEDSFNSRFASYLREEYEEGNISDYEAQRMLINYGDKTEDEATSKVQYWEFKQEYPDYDDLSEEAVAKYYEKVEPYGITVDVYYDYSKQKSKCKGVDANGDGKTDSGSKKAEILQVINSLPLTYSQKDALYYLNGWSAKTIYEAPWH